MGGLSALATGSEAVTVKRQFAILGICFRRMIKRQATTTPIQHLHCMNLPKDPPARRESKQR